MSELPDVEGWQTVQPLPDDHPLRQQNTTPPTLQRDLERARLTVVERLGYQQIGARPFALESAFSVWLDSQEEPYSRTFRVAEEWQPLDYGWMASASLLVLRNEEGLFHGVNPTEEVRQQVAARVLELGRWVAGDTVTAFASVQPQHSLRFEPLDLSAFRIRCRCGAAKYRLTLMPR